MPYRCDKCGRPQFGCYDAEGRHYLGKYTTDDGPEVSHWVRCDDGSVMLPNGDMVDAVGEFGCFDDELLLTEADLDGTGIACPPVRRYLPALVDHMRRHPDISSAAMV